MTSDRPFHIEGIRRQDCQQVLVGSTTDLAKAQVIAGRMTGRDFYDAEIFQIENGIRKTILPSTKANVP